tara:strand:+ start:5230 stop:6195 length:966 start_codon:yes stop_codon:yes gene_type:complete
MQSVKYYQNKVVKEKLSVCEFHNMITKVSAITNNNHSSNDIVVLHTFIDFDIIFHEKTGFDNSKFDIMWCAYFDENMKKKEGLFMEILFKFASENKTIIVYNDFYNYLIDEEKFEKTNRLHYVSHGTMSLFYPTTKRNSCSETCYQAYHFNSHGCATKEANWHYKKQITRTRAKTYVLDLPLDYYVFQQFVDSINNHFTTNYSSAIQYTYKPTNQYNYMGPNLQQGDKHGICYVFPFMLTYYISKNYHTEYKRLTQKGNINKIIYKIMSSYVYDFTALSGLHDSDESINTITDIISKKGGSLIRYWLHDFIKILHTKTIEK